MKPPIHTLQAGFFPNALAALAEYVQFGSRKHNGDGPVRWSYDVASEHAESAARHLADIGTLDPESGQTHALGLATRALMLLETELIEAGARPGWAVVRSKP